MTDALPNFRFDRKSCELQRGHRVGTLCRLHADFFVLLQSGPASVRELQQHAQVGGSESAMHGELRAFARALKPFGISVEVRARHRERFRALVFGPQRKPVEIPPPVTLEEVVVMSERKERVLSYEAQAMQFAGHHGIEQGTFHAECLIDGAFNALIRINGRESAAEFAFKLQDRVVAGLREPTLMPHHRALLDLKPPRDEPKQAPIESVEQPTNAAVKPVDTAATQPKPIRFWLIFLGGWLCGFVAGRMVGR